MDRIKVLKKRIKNISDAEDIMVEVMDVFNETELIPTVGKYYTFVYNAKTPGIVYDQHPLVAIIGVQKWGFEGINFHWGDVRRYTWQEIPGSLHVVRNSEIMSLRNINYAKFKTN